MTGKTMRGSIRQRVLTSLLLLVSAAGVWFLFTDDVRVWPYRNTLQYHLFRTLSQDKTVSDALEGVLAGTVHDPAGAPIPNARVLVSSWNGATWSAETGSDGLYRIPHVPAGRHVAVASAPGYEIASTRALLLNHVHVRAGMTTKLGIRLVPDTHPELLPVSTWRMSAPRRVQITTPLPATADEYDVFFEVNGRPSQRTLFYTPVGGAASLPTLLAVYPGPAHTWASVSMPLAQAGYAVIAVGPEYALDLEPDVDDLVRIITKLREGAFPRANPERLGLLGGSYSSLHVFRLAQRNPALSDAILVLGPPTDLFELRRLFEERVFLPPFGLDKAFIALGSPSREPERYFRYSPRFYARAIRAPIMLIHSKMDEVVPFTQSELLAAELARLGKPHELKILEGMGHYLLEPERTPAVDDLFNTTVAFFQRELRRP